MCIRLLGPKVNGKTKTAKKIIAHLPILAGSYIVAIGIYYRMLKLQYDENKKNK
jgi:hypothetical protein